MIVFLVFRFLRVKKDSTRLMARRAVFFPEKNSFGNGEILFSQLIIALLSVQYRLHCRARNLFFDFSPVSTILVLRF